RRSVDTEAPQAVYENRALALIRRARDVPLLECEAIPAGGQPEPVAAAGEPRLFQQFLRAARVVAIPDRYTAQHRLVVVGVWMAVDIPQQSVACRDSLVHRFLVDRVRERLPHPRVRRQLFRNGVLRARLDIQAASLICLPDHLPAPGSPAALECEPFLPKQQAFDG